MTRLGGAITLAVAAAASTVGGGAGSAQAQINIPLLPTTTTTTSQPGEPATTTPPTTGSLVGALLKPVTQPTTTAPSGPPALVPAPSGGTILPNAGGEGVAPPADAGPFPDDLRRKMNSVRRSGARSSDQLVDSLQELIKLGVPEEEVMRVGMGRFPVAGRTRYIDDWWFPRFGPGWRLHEGTDLFAARGTPVRSPANGTATFSNGGLGGIAVYVTQTDGTYFYMAHLDRRAPGLRPGQQVSVGDIVGFVGSTGNAAGGSPHLHFEVHPAVRIVTVGKGKKATTKAVSAPVRPGTVLPPINPKPLLDVYAQEALAQVPALIESYKAKLPPPAEAVAPAGPAVPTEVVLAAHRSGGFIAADAPLARTPLMGLAFVLMIMVVVLVPVLHPRRRVMPAMVASSASRTGRRQVKKQAKKGDGDDTVDLVALEARLASFTTVSGENGEKAYPPKAVVEPPLPAAVTFRGHGLQNGNGNGNGNKGKRSKPPAPPKVTKPERTRRRPPKSPGSDPDDDQLVGAAETT